jgi:hypothetical protein
MTATLPVTVGRAGTGGQAGSYGGGTREATPSGRTLEAVLSCGTREATLNGRPAGGASLVEQGYVRARFGGVPVLVGPELAAQLKAIGQKQP